MLLVAQSHHCWLSHLIPFQIIYILVEGHAMKIPVKLLYLDGSFSICIFSNCWQTDGQTD